MFNDHVLPLHLLSQLRISCSMQATNTLMLGSGNNYRCHIQR